jgi:hydroxyacylglutathione hydrolase
MPGHEAETAAPVAVGEGVWRVTGGTFSSNAYICASGQGDDASSSIRAWIRRRSTRRPRPWALTPRQVFCTHGHFDHIGGAAYFQKAYGAEVFVHPADLKTMKSGNFLLMVLKIAQRIELPQVTTVDVAAGPIIVGGRALTYHPVPGHTPGSCFIEYGDALFTGDSLYARGVGLSDLPGEDHDGLRRSLLALWDQIPAERMIHAGPRRTRPPSAPSAPTIARCWPSCSAPHQAPKIHLAPKIQGTRPDMSSPSGIRIIGVGHHLPDIIEDNAQLCVNLDVTPEWIIEKTGIKRRYLAGPDETASGLALKAARRALASGRLGARRHRPDRRLHLLGRLHLSRAFGEDPQGPGRQGRPDLRPAGQLRRLRLGPHGRQRPDGRGPLGAQRPGHRGRAEQPLHRPRQRRQRHLSQRRRRRRGAGPRPGRGVIASAFHTDSSNYEAVRVRAAGRAFP